MPCGIHHQVGGADGDDDAEDRGPAADADVVLVVGILVDQRLVDVVGPHRGKGAHVAGHAAHEARNQRRDAEAEQAGRQIANHHQRQHFVVAVQSRARGGEVLSDKVHQAAVGILEHDETEQAGQNHDEGHAPF